MAQNWTKVTWKCQLLIQVTFFFCNSLFQCYVFMCCSRFAVLSLLQLSVSSHPIPRCVREDLRERFDIDYVLFDLKIRINWPFLKELWMSKTALNEVIQFLFSWCFSLFLIIALLEGFTIFFLILPSIRKEGVSAE